MHVIKTIQPNSPDARRFLHEWDEKLVAVRYRDAGNQTTLTTIEIVVDQRQKHPLPLCTNRQLSQYRKEIVALQCKYKETELRQNLKAHGALWSPQLKLWLMQRNTAISMGLQSRIIEGAAEKCTDIDTSLIE